MVNGIARIGLLCGDNFRARVYLGMLSILAKSFPIELRVLLLKSGPTDLDFVKRRKNSLNEFILRDAQLPADEARWINLALEDLNFELSMVFERSGLRGDFFHQGEQMTLYEHFQLAFTNCDYVIYAGPPGRILKAEELLSLPNVYHSHPGALPEYRGSTTFYYQCLDRKPPVVSLIQLAPTLDAGGLVLEFVPEYSFDPNYFDHIYDHLFRARAFNKFVKSQCADPSKPPPSPQAKEKGDLGQPYYVIHPQLKYYAVKSCCNTNQ